jgi:hypothetical protein
MHAEHTQVSLRVCAITSKALVNSAQNDLVNIRSTKRALHMHRTMHACHVSFSDKAHVVVIAGLDPAILLRRALNPHQQVAG